MYIREWKEYFNAIGILWSSSKVVSKEMLFKIGQKYDVKEIIIMDLKDKYRDFILECYTNDDDAMSDGYIEEKVNRLLEDGTGQIIIFTLDVENPKFRYNSEMAIKKQCIQIRELKEGLRKEYKQKINNYFLDNIIHISDNEEESKWIKNVVQKYKNYTKRTYLRKGEKSIIEKQGFSYINVVGSINDDAR